MASQMKPNALKSNERWEKLFVPLCFPSCINAYLIILNIQDWKYPKTGGSEEEGGGGCSSFIRGFAALQCEDAGIFMKANCVQMLIFKQRSIRWINPPPPAPDLLMKSSAGAEGTAAALRAQLNERTAHDSAPLGSSPEGLGQLSGVKHRPSKPPLQAWVPGAWKNWGPAAGGEKSPLEKRWHFGSLYAEEQMNQT